MTNRLNLSEKEKELIINLRKEEDDKLPKMFGFAKEDLYQVDDYQKDDWFASKSERDQIIKDFIENCLELSVPAGSKFDCYIENGEESWYDTESGLFAGMDAEWAQKYLRDIQPCKKIKKRAKK